MFREHSSAATVRNVLVIFTLSYFVALECAAERPESINSTGSTVASTLQPDQQIAVLDLSAAKAIKVLTIDGNKINNRPDRVDLRPGEHRIVLLKTIKGRKNGGQSKSEVEHPISFTVVAGHSYSLKQSWDDFGHGFEMNNIWIEDMNTGEVVAGSSSPSVSLSSGAVHLTQWRSLCKNAVDGSGEARSSIGSHYQNGWAPAQKNAVLAFKWFRLAAEAGYTAAEEYRYNLEKEMTRQQVEKAETLAADWNADVSTCVNEALTGSSM